MSDPRMPHDEGNESHGSDVPGDDVETGTATGGASAFPGAPSAAPDEPAPDGDSATDVDTTTDDGGQPLDNPSGG